MTRYSASRELNVGNGHAHAFMFSRADAPA
jgi:hypothetical protein